MNNCLKMFQVASSWISDCKTKNSYKNVHMPPELFDESKISENSTVTEKKQLIWLLFDTAQAVSRYIRA